MLISAFDKKFNSKIGFGESVDRFFFEWGKISGIKAEVKNAEVLKNQERLRIYVPTHRDPNLDSIAFASLKVNNPIVFGALNLKNHPIFGAKENPLMNQLVRALEENDSFILAGSSETPIDKFIRLVKKNKLSNALIYPEGQVSLGIKETRPVRKTFSISLLSRLLREGIDFELVPVTYDNGAQHFQWHNEISKIKFEPGQENLKVVVHDPIKSEVVAKYINAFGADSFNTYLRFVWLLNLPTDDDHILGQSRWAIIKQSLEKKFPEKANCPIIFKNFLK